MVFLLFSVIVLSNASLFVQVFYFLDSIVLTQHNGEVIQTSKSVLLAALVIWESGALLSDRLAS